MEQLLMQRYIGLDVGTKRIGVALSDPLLITAQPLEAIAREPEEQSLSRISSLCKEYDVLGIVVGFPKNMNGTVGPQAEDCKNFGDKIKNITGLEVFFEDERLTSKQAEQALALQGKKYTKNKSLVDITSAVLILQQFLDRRS